METITKIDVRTMKADIKKMVEEQKSYRLQRKYELPEGMVRTVSQSEAQWKHRANREKLRIMYAAYGQARGKSFEQVESNHTIPPHPLEKYADIINDKVNKYKIQVPVEVQVQE